ncbi:alpha/beta fold hydrolase [Streptomyces sp. BG9H]|uniref:Alpha/beta fold hydrolase n=1 Tax=Streptomyces anatolicus TaxID=2675858 RepID=A0ABS6YIY1_9ACTN|nr:alpha/beta hydrolase [Streptomyces anatolicus]MBW5421382.1 alpha/beta fold hydrolase [Streptomyces anatolicus]
MRTNTRLRVTATATIRVTVAAAAVLAVGAGALPATASTPAEPLSPTGKPTSLARYYDQTPDWHKCTLGPDDTTGRQLDAAGAQCADVTVPLDYSDPGGRTLTVALSRLRATDSARRVGPLLLNNGGPGGPSLDMPLLFGKAMDKVARKYDLIGMDPRFVGRSTPLDCGWDVGSTVFSAGRDRAGFQRSVARQRDLAERCRRTNGDVLPYVTTRNTARDMDVIRGVLGAKRISYFGYSYGSYLGAVYTELFPGRTDRMVLDGVIDPARYSQTLLEDATAANERALDDWAAWVAARDETYGLGSTPGAVRATVERVQEAAADKPLRVGKFRVDEHFVPVVYFAGLGSDLDRERDQLASVTRTLARAADRERVEPGPWLAKMLESLTTEAGSHQGSAQSAILCGDVATRRGTQSYWRDIQVGRKTAPFASPLTRNISACEFWDRPAEAPTVVDNDVPALLVNATGDTRTTYAGARQVREKWSRSRLLTVPGANQHGVYADYGNACVDKRVNAYLDTGELPARDVVCRGE